MWDWFKNLGRPKKPTNIDYLNAILDRVQVEMTVDQHGLVGPVKIVIGKKDVTTNTVDTTISTEATED